MLFLWVLSPVLNKCAQDGTEKIVKYISYHHMALHGNPDVRLWNKRKKDVMCLFSSIMTEVETTSLERSGTS